MCCTRSLKSTECRIDRRLPFASKPGEPRAETRPLTGGAVRPKLASGPKRNYAGERAFVLHSLAAELPWKSRSRYDELVSGRTVYTYVGNDPENRVDPSGKDPGDPFGSVDQAAQDAVNSINPISIQTNTEFGGALFQIGENYYASSPEAGAGDHVTITYRGPKGSFKGTYHTHGDYSKKGKDGKPERTTKAKDEYDSDHFSDPDKDNAANNKKRTGDPDYKDYLGTPSGQTKRYSPKNRKEDNAPPPPPPPPPPKPPMIGPPD